jgi:mutator protein MutT
MKTLVVTAAIVERDDRFLLTRRLTGTHLAGHWEFPGGKCEADESLADCLRRELLEELGVDADIGDEVFRVSHDYEDRRVQLHFMRCVLRGAPQPLLGQEMRWAARADLAGIEFPPADLELIRLLMKRQC